MSDLDDDGGDATSHKAGDNSQIEVYGRLRPSNKNDKTTTILADDRRGIDFHLPHDASSAGGNVINNKKELYSFKMQHIYDEATTQEQVFEGIGKPVVQNVMQGFNGTIFAYGQTGSGKTFTITGGPDRYEDRGLIPRTLSMIFEEKAARAAELQYSVSISYLGQSNAAGAGDSGKRSSAEIYNDDGYDLLDANHDTKELSQLPKVAMFEDDAGQIHMRNIHLLPANSVDEALNLLFVGDTNRIICSTPSNDASTRSHCIFTIYIECREVGGSKIRRSKLHLVDLAGSERIKKTQIAGKILTEALAINLALHYLEQVIVALHKRSKDKNTHVPYRNSMMTSVLRDSLGGNCKTVMIATLSGQRAHIDESISTCRFAARVAMVRNAAFINEEIDPKLLIRKLKLQVRELREELAAARGDKINERALDEDELERCRSMVTEYVTSEKPAPLEGGMPNRQRLEACFAAFKDLILAAQNGAGGAAVATAGTAMDGAAAASVGLKGSRRLHPGVAGGSGGVTAVAALPAATEEELKRLRLMVSSRDNEIAILVSLLKSHVPAGQDIPMLESVRNRAFSAAQAATGIEDVALQAIGGGVQQSLLHSKGVAKIAEQSQTRSAVDSTPLQEDSSMLAARLASFEEFRRSYRKNALLEEQKDSLRAKIEAAQQMGEQINRSRGDIERAKKDIEQRRMQRGVAMLGESGAAGESLDPASLPPDPEEDRLRASIDSSKHAYRSSFESLRTLKSEIEHLKAIIDRSRRKLQADFDTWWTEQQAMQKGTSASSAGPAPTPLSARSNPSSYPAASPSSSPPPSRSPTASPPAGASRPAYPASQGLISGSLAAANGPQPSYSSSSSASSSASGQRPTHSSSGSSSSAAAAAPARLPSTGNAQADADIAKFYAMRDSLMKQQQANAQQR